MSMTASLTAELIGLAHRLLPIALKRSAKFPYSTSGGFAIGSTAHVLPPKFFTHSSERCECAARLSLGRWFLANVALDVSPPEQGGQGEQRRDEGPQRKGEGGVHGEEES